MKPRNSPAADAAGDCTTTCGIRRLSAQELSAFRDEAKVRRSHNRQPAGHANPVRHAGPHFAHSERMRRLRSRRRALGQKRQKRVVLALARQNRVGRRARNFIAEGAVLPVLRAVLQLALGKRNRAAPPVAGRARQIGGTKKKHAGQTRKHVRAAPSAPTPFTSVFTAHGSKKYHLSGPESKSAAR